MAIPDCIEETVLPNDKIRALAEQLVGAEQFINRLQTDMELSFAPSLLFSWMQRHRIELARCPKFRGTALLVGPSGTGKTSVAMVSADCYARSSNSTAYLEELGLVREKFVGQSSRNVKRAFDYVKLRAEHSKVVFLINEFDSVGVARNTEQMHDDVRAMVNTLIQEMDKLDNHNIFIIATSNFEGKIDHAVKRRFDDIVEFKRPSLEERIKLFGSLLQGGNFSKYVITVFAKRTERFTQDNITRAVKLAIRTAFSNDEPLTARHVLQAIKEMKPTGDYDGQ